MVINGVMNEGVAATVLLVVAVTDRASEFAVSAAVGDPAEFLDIDVDHVAGLWMLVTAWSRPADDQARVVVEMP